MGLAACTFDEPNVSVTEQGLACDPDFCMTNSPLMTQYGTWEFNVKGVRNGQGIQILGLSKDAEFYDLRVEESRIVGYDAGGKPSLRGSDLVDARIYLDIGGKQHAIVITSQTEITDLLSPNTLDTYVMDWGDVIDHPLRRLMHAGDTVEGGAAGMPVLGPTTNVCPEPEWLSAWGGGGAFEWDETLHMHMAPYQSVVFEGDRFDPETRTVNPKPDDDWFNVGCGTHTLAKLRLTRHTLHTAPSWEYVQAALKMYGADYCGGGTSFTFAGEPLQWRDQNTSARAMFYLSPHPTDTLEARWDENGALCIGDARLLNSPNPLAPTTFPYLLKDIQRECYKRGHVFRPCKDLDPNVTEFSGELITSLNHD